METTNELSSTNQTAVSHSSFVSSLSSKVDTLNFVNADFGLLTRPSTRLVVSLKYIIKPGPTFSSRERRRLRIVCARKRDCSARLNSQYVPWLLTVFIHDKSISTFPSYANAPCAQTMHIYQSSQKSCQNDSKRANTPLYAYRTLCPPYPVPPN